MLMFDAVVPVRAGAGGNTAAPGGGTAGTVQFRIDPDEAQKMINGLKAAIEKLAELERKAGRLQKSGAPGPDPYSGWATLAMRQAAGKDPGGYAWANEAAQKALEKTIENMEKALAVYRGTDEAAQTALKG